MSKFNKHIAVLFLALFTLIKIAGLHSLTHSDDEHTDECDVCEYVIISNTTPFTADNTVLFEQSVEHNYNKQSFYEYCYSFTTNYTSGFLFGRPPPTV